MVLVAEIKNNKSPKTSKRNLAICLVTGIIAMSIFILLVFMNPLPMLVQMSMRASKGSPLHDFLLKERVEGIIVSTYLFNVTNPDRFISGEDDKLKLEEVGPFTYKELRTNEDVELDEEAQEIRYTPRIDLVFMPNMSIGYPEDINITMPNIPMLGMTSQISSHPYLTRMAYNLLIGQLQSSPLVTINAQEYIWGYHDPLVTLGNTIVPGIINFDKIGFLDRFYDKNTKNRIIVSAKDEEKFMVKSRNGHRRLNMEARGNPDECHECDTFENTFEGIVYPLPFTPETKIRMFKEGICRVLDMVYNDTRTLDNGAEGLVYNLSESFFSTTLNDKIYSGLVDFTKCCFGIPVVLSKGHCLDVNPTLYERIEGLRPDASKYNSHIIIEPKMGIEVETHFSIQFNLMLDDLHYNSKASMFSNMLLPIGHSQMVQPKLTEENLGYINLIYFKAPLLMLSIKIAFFLLGLVLIGISVRILYWRWFCKEKGYTDSEQKKSTICAEEPLMLNAKS